MKNSDIIVDYLNELFPNPKCELEFSTDYELLIAVMLSAQTKDSRVNEVTRVLYKKYPTVLALSKANLEDVKKIIKSIGTYNVKAKNDIEISKRLLNDYDGHVPNNREYLESLPGVGHKTTNVVLSMLFDDPCFAVDTHVKRVSTRLKIAKSDDSLLDIENKLAKYFKKYKINRLHHQFVLFGRYYCKAINPECINCKLKNICIKKWFIL